MLSPLVLKIEMLLRDLQMSTRNCAGIVAYFPKIKTSRTALTDALAGKTTLDDTTAQQIIDLLHELQQVRKMFAIPTQHLIPLDFSQHEQIADLVLVTRYNQIVAEEKVS